MNIRSLLFSSALIISSLSVVNAQTPANCGTDKMMQEAIEQNPSLEAWFDEFNQWISENEDVLSQTDAGDYIVPVVVHVIHAYGSEYISDAQIADAIRILNEDFQKLNADTTNVVNIFKPIIGKANFEFRLAKKDPQGNCTNGITRTYSALTFDARDNVKPLSSWPRNKYFNIWVVYNIDNGNEMGVTAGYAYLPGFSPSATVDGIILDHRYTGSIGQSQGNNFAARVITHETGHFFGLLHPWGNGSCGSGCGNDQVNDTPTTSGACNNCNLNQMTCSNDGLDNVQNFMDYGTCSNMFTLGQVSRMTAAINNTAGQRSSLWTNTNLTATGTNDGFDQDCTPRADFSANKSSICAGTPVLFSDRTWNATATSWAWTFTNGQTTLTSNLQNPNINFTDPGLYTVTLTVSAPGGNNSITKTSYIHVFPDGAEDVNWVYYDAFDNSPIGSGRWKNLYAENTSVGFAETQAASFSPPNSIKLDNYNGAAGRVYNFVSPSYDFTSITGTLKLTYKYAYARRSSNNTDMLRVYISSNCGNTWSLRKTVTGNDLLTGGTVIGAWTPSGPSQWKTDSIGGLQPWATKNSVRVRFEFTSGGGNNFYLDDVNISSITGIESYTKEDIALDIFPNPATELVNVRFTLDDDYDVTITLTDLTGKVISQIPQKHLLPAGHLVQVPLPPSLSRGLYLLNINIGGKSYVEKIAVH